MVLNISEEDISNYKKNNCIYRNDNKILSEYHMYISIGFSIILAVLLALIIIFRQYINRYTSLLVLPVLGLVIYIIYKNYNESNDYNNKTNICIKMDTNNPDIVYAQQFLDLS